MKYLVKFDYGFVSKINKSFFYWTDPDEKPMPLSEEDKDKAVENMQPYNFKYEVIEVNE